MKDFDIGTFNTQGCKTSEKRYSIARDASKYNISLLGLVKRNIGKSKTTWIQVVKNDVKNSILEINLNDDETFFKELEAVCKDRIRWKHEIRHMLL